MDAPKRTLTRKELYDLVWSTPILKLAEQFGLSDRGLAKICERNQVPVPGRGYWARLEAGQKVTKTPLRKMYTPELETVHIGGFRQEASPYVAFAIEVTKAAKRAVAEATQRSEATQSKAVETAPETKGVTAKTKLHPSLREFAAEIRSVVPDRDGTVQLRWVKVHRNSIPRAIAFLNTLAIAFEPYGISFCGSGSRVQFADSSAAVDFEITSPKKRVVKERGGWKFHKNVYVGRLAFQIYGNAEGIRKNWVDSDGKTIEDCIDSIVENYRVNLLVQKEHDDKNRGEAKRREYLAHRRDLAEKRRLREEHRHEFLTSLARARREVDELKLTISAIPTNERLPLEYDRMLVWAKERLAALEARTTIECLQEALVEQNLFPEPDDLFDPEGEPPPKRNYWDD
ncbi:hypothetical protein EHS39_23905 [Ensifer sp. MPMI2T]|nr:hypothetical protein EHS39_23905 [Ensifer sp. MPMI2T]